MLVLPGRQSIYIELLSHAIRAAIGIFRVNTALVSLTENALPFTF